MNRISNHLLKSPKHLLFVQIRSQVHISERLSALGLTRHGFVLCRKGISVGLGVGVVYKLPFASSTKRCETIFVYPEQKPTVEAKGFENEFYRSHRRRH
ncbi:hypothetical protein QL285_040695 [Trifolium repens]|nr:hypothetical protein QL285_040695 [Trifolium repens]